MAVYKVPQDVEAEDKLLGPFSFKQFIFLIVAVAGIGIAYGLSQIALPLILVPSPIILFFGALALPLRKDQPMEVYLAAVISFMLKPRLRLWQPDGIDKLIEVIAPPVDETQFGKGYSQEEVQRRLSYLANLVDSQGWSVRNTTAPTSSMQPDLYNEAQATYDPFDESGTRSQQIDTLLTRTNDERRQQIIDRMKQPLQTPTLAPAAPTMTVPFTPQPSTTAYSAFPQYGSATPAISSGYTPMSVVYPTTPDEDIALVVNPYPSMNQGVIQPMGEEAPVATQPTPEPDVIPVTPEPTPPRPITQDPEPLPKHPSEEPISPAIIDLANNHKDLSVETLQREAERIKKKELKESEEIIISLR